MAPPFLSEKEPSPKSQQMPVDEYAGSRVACRLPLHNDEVGSIHSRNSRSALEPSQHPRSRRIFRIIAGVVTVAILYHAITTAAIFAPSRICQMSKSLLSHHKHKAHPHSQQHIGIANDCNITSTVSESIQGNFDLWDCLQINSVSASIDITITPKPGQGPSKLLITSNSGSINVRLHDDFLSALRASSEDKITISSLSRPIDSKFTSTAASIDLAWIIGNGGTTEVISNAGQLKLDLEAVNIGPDDESTILKTVTQSAQQTVNIRPFLSHSGDGKITNLRSEHVVKGSGQMDIVYPKEWEGNFSAAALGHGAVRVSGDGLIFDVVQTKLIKAHKGTGEGFVSLFEAGSGSLKFCLV